MEPLNYISGKIEKITETGCWVWMGSLSRSGYAIGRPEGVSVRVHRWLYKKLNGDIGDLTLDHLCRNRCCINPSHLEPVTQKENVLRGIGATAENARKTTCKNGHKFDRIVVRSSGAIIRRCMTCHNARGRVYKAAKRAAMAEQKK